MRRPCRQSPSLMQLAEVWLAGEEDGQAEGSVHDGCAAWYCRHPQYSALHNNHAPWTGRQGCTWSVPQQCQGGWTVVCREYVSKAIQMGDFAMMTRLNKSDCFVFRSPKRRRHAPQRTSMKTHTHTPNKNKNMTSWCGHVQKFTMMF